MAKQLKITAFFNSPGAPLSKPETMTRLDSDEEAEKPSKARRKRPTATTPAQAAPSPPKKPVEPAPVVTMSDDEDSDEVQKPRARRVKETPKITARPKPAVIKRTPKRKRHSSDSAGSESSSDISISKGEFILLSSSSSRESSPEKSSQPTNVQDGIIGMKVRSPTNGKP